MLHSKDESRIPGTDDTARFQSGSLDLLDPAVPLPASAILIVMVLLTLNMMKINFIIMN